MHTELHVSLSTFVPFLAVLNLENLYASISFAELHSVHSTFRLSTQRPHFAYALHHRWHFLIKMKQMSATVPDSTNHHTFFLDKILNLVR